MSTLYAKITNEKGKTAGKGGNEYIDIDIQVGNQRIAKFSVRKIHDDYVSLHDKREIWAIFDRNDNIIERSSIEATGNTQKSI